MDARGGDLSQTALLDEGAQAAVVGVEPLVESRGVPHPGGVAGGDHCLGVGEGGRHRFLAEDVLARSGRGFHQGTVQMVGRGDVHGFQAGRGEEVGEGGVAGEAGVVRREAGAGRRVRVADGDEPGSWGRGDPRGDVVPRDPAATHDSPLDGRGYVHGWFEHMGQLVRARRTGGCTQNTLLPA